MKINRFAVLAVITAAGIFACSLNVQAQDSTGKRSRGDRPGNMAQRVETMKKELNLTAEQEKKLTALYEEQGKKMQGMRDLPQEERREKGRAMREEINAKMKQILKPEQYEKWQKIRAERGPGAASSENGKDGKRKGEGKGEGKKRNRS